uniref:Uncharacterized protein n=1 Tax=Anopheles atroparvus TaxID=41427 RepID=A0A182JJC7_ANOAO
MDTTDQQYWLLFDGFLDLPSYTLNLEHMDLGEPSSEGTSEESAGGCGFEMFGSGSAVGLQSQIINDCMWTGLCQEQQHYRQATSGADVELQKQATVVMGGEASSRSLETQVGLVGASFKSPVNIRSPFEPTRSWAHIPNGGSLLSKNYPKQEQQQPHQKQPEPQQRQQAGPVSTRNYYNSPSISERSEDQQKKEQVIPVLPERNPARGALLSEKDRQVLAPAVAEHLNPHPDTTTSTIDSNQQSLLLHTPPSSFGKSRTDIEEKSSESPLRDSRSAMVVTLSPPPARDSATVGSHSNILFHHRSFQLPLVHQNQHDGTDLHDHQLHQQQPVPYRAVPRERTCVLHRSLLKIYSASPNRPDDDEENVFARDEEEDDDEEQENGAACSVVSSDCVRMHTSGGGRCEFRQVAYVGDYSYTRPKVSCCAQTSSVTVEEIDVVSLVGKNLPNARNRQLLESCRPPNIAPHYNQNRREHIAERGHYQQQHLYPTPASSTMISCATRPPPTGAIVSGKPVPSGVARVIRGGGASKRKRSCYRSPEQRNSKNTTEKRRRLRLNHLFEVLKQQIPSLKKERRVSQLKILRKAAALCTRLIRKSAQLNELRQRQKQLYEQVQQFRVARQGA